MMLQKNKLEYLHANKKLMFKNIFAVSKKHDILAIFTYTLQRIQRVLPNIVISFFLPSFVPVRKNTKSNSSTCDKQSLNGRNVLANTVPRSAPMLSALRTSRRTNLARTYSLKELMQCFNLSSIMGYKSQMNILVH